MIAPLLFLIPARGGSQRIAGKNVRTVAGIPLVGRAARIARQAAANVAGGPHRVVCSTDDAGIAEAAREWGAEVLSRPAELATATASSIDVILHALATLADEGAPAFRGVVVVQPTSPLTEAADLVGAVEQFDQAGGAAVVGVTRSHPAGFHVAVRPTAAPGVAGAIEAIEPNDAPATDVLSGAVYVVAPDRIRSSRTVMAADTIGFRMPPERSVDVDEPADLAIAEALAAARPIRPVVIGHRVIGEGNVFVIAEVGVNHDGSVDLAHRLIDVAADAGADAVKFQTFDPDALAAAGAPRAEYQQRRGGEGDDQRTMLAALALPAPAWGALRDHAADRGVLFLSTPFDDGSADLLDRIGVPAFKVASGELTNLPFLQRLARRGRPMLVSTGMADLREVAQAVDSIAAAGDPPLALLHCVSDYPARAADANLRAIATMRAAFLVPVGWSDHTLGIELALAAVAAGASLIEKHLTMSRELPGPDHAASLEPDELGAMIAGVRTVEAALGSGIKEPVKAERAIALVARRSLHWARSLRAGERVAEEDVIALRPGTGLSPALTAEVVGHAVLRDVTEGDLLDRADIGVIVEPGS